MATIETSRLSTLAKIQVAAEAVRLGDINTGQISLQRALERGNDRTTASPAPIATGLIRDGWTLGAHQTNTLTGFSGSVFINNKTNDIVLSFRSTEFVDDYARDNIATNELEVNAAGWAFGQIADMERWYQSLTAPGGVLAGKTFSVTGYSLGGHLATAFNLLHVSEGRITSTYTFNGAGVGKVAPYTNLAAVIRDFDRQRSNVDGQQIKFDDANLNALYRELRQRLSGGVAPTRLDLERANALVRQATSEAMVTMDPAQRVAALERQRQAKLLVNALNNIGYIISENERSRTLTSGSLTSPAPQRVENLAIDATRLDYRLAVLNASTKTSASGLIANGMQVVFGRSLAPQLIANMFDVYGEAPPTVVANSQTHYGTPTPVAIENQPPIRGESGNLLSAQIRSYTDRKFLVDRFALNDFGDTHSLVLIVDSLSLQAAMARLAGTAEDARFSALLSAASNAKMEWALGTQGKAEGDTLERALDGLRRMLLPASFTGTPASLLGNTWADPKAREIFHANLDMLTGSSAFEALAGKVDIVLATRDVTVSARKDFTALLALVNASPLMLKAKAGQTGAVESSLASVHGPLHARWQADSTGEMSAGAALANFSDTWIEDRSALLSVIVLRNLRNTQAAFILDRTISGHAALEFRFSEFDSATSAVATRVLRADGSPDIPKPRRVIGFGADQNDTITGYDDASGDHLFGEGGSDRILGLGGRDHLEGGIGSDSLFGNLDNDTLIGGDGDDLLEGGAGDDELYGGDGVDLYRFSLGSGHDRIEDKDGYGSIDIDGLGPINGQGANLVAPGTWQTADKRINYTLVDAAGSRKDMYISFSDRTDVITVRNWREAAKLGITLGSTPAPAPSVATSLAGDFAKRTVGNSYAFANGNYVSNGVQANAADVISGTAQADRLQGLGGNDALAGMAGDDLLDGGAGADLLHGGVGRDSLFGGDGSDFLFGAGKGELSYLPGPAALPPAAYGPELARGFSWVAYGKGIDANGVDVYLIDGAAFGWDPGDVGNLIDGGAGDDKAVGGPGVDTIHGGLDNDVIDGLGGADLLYGDAGNDQLSGDGTNIPGYGSSVAATAHGNDLLDGGAGNDSLEGQGGDDVLYGGADDDRLWGDDADLRSTPTLFHGADALDGGDGADELSGGGRGDTLVGGRGNDTLFGDAPLAQLPGNEHGEDVLDGGAGADYIEGGGQADTLLGGSDNDMLWGDSATTGLLGSESGADLIDGGEGADSLVGGAKGDTLRGGAGRDVLEGDGPVVDAVDQGDDLLEGGPDDDILRGQAGADALDGGLGDDQLDGGSGNDTLKGGTGTDILSGGLGSDTYVWTDGELSLSSAGQAEQVDDPDNSNTFVFDALSTATLTVTPAANGDLQLNFSPTQALIIRQGASGDGNLYRIGGVDFSTHQLIGQWSGTATRTVDSQGRPLVFGGKANDSLSTTLASATLSGGRGDDSLTASGGRNTYRYDLGDGSDTITDTSAKTTGTGAPMPNRIVFGAGITRSDISLSNKSGIGQMRLQVGANASEGITLGGFDAAAASSQGPIDHFEFADGSMVSFAQLLAQGFDGGAGDDSLTGSATGDRINGHGGNDSLSGGPGGDTYEWQPQGDLEVVMDGDASAVAFDTLRIGAGALPGSFSYLRNNNDLIIRGQPGIGQVTVVGQFGGTGIERFSFDDGTVWTAADITARLNNRLTEGNDNYVGTQGDDFLSALGGNDSVSGLGGNDAVDGGAGDDELWGGPGHDTLIGGDGHDRLYDDIGNDALDGGAGNDAMSGGRGDDLLDGGIGIDLLTGDDGNDRLKDGETMYGGAGSDRYQLSAWQSASIFESTTDLTDIDTLDLPIASTEVDIMLGRNSASGSLDDLVLRNGAGAVTVVDFFRNDAGSGTIEFFRWANGVSSSAAELLARAPAHRVSDGDDTLVQGFRWGDTINALGGDDSVHGNLGNDRLHGGRGNDTVFGDAGADTVEGGLGEDLLYGDIGGASFTGDEADMLDGGDGDDTLVGGGSDDSLIGGVGHDQLFGGDGADTLQGQAGDDLLSGGSGNDVYRVAVDGGVDTLDDTSGANRIQLATGIVPADIGLYRDGTTLWVTVKSSGAQVRVMNHFNSPTSLQRIEFADGSFWDSSAIAARAVTGLANVMTGTSVNDNFQVDNDADIVTEAANQGVDTIASTVTIELPANVENLSLQGVLSLRATGNDLDNLLTGNDANNVLDGRGGQDTLSGRGGDDTYIVSPLQGDVVVEQSGWGIDTVIVDHGYTLPAHVENMRGTVFTTRTVFKGNELDNRLTITDGDQTGHVMDGGTGADTMINLAAGTTFHVDNPADVVVGQQAHVVSSIDWTLAPGWRDLRLLPGAVRGTGNAGANQLVGNGRGDLLEGLDGDDVFHAASGYIRDRDWSYDARGIDTLDGGMGNDRYLIDWSASGHDIVIERPGEGDDTITVQGIERQYDLADFANVEHLALAAVTGAAGLTGSSARNMLTGNDSSNLIAGNDGNDELLDQPLSSLWGDQDTLLGGRGDDVLYSFGGSDLLDGGAGNDMLNIKGWGEAKIAWGLGEGSDVVDAVGPSARSILLKAGMPASSLSMARQGTDLLLGLGGSDSLRWKGYFSADVSSLPSGSLDRIRFADGLQLMPEHIAIRLQNNNQNLFTAGADVVLGGLANDTMAGAAGDDLLGGDAGDDDLTGGLGADTLYGGGGNDTYRFSRGDGTDLILDQTGTADVLIFGPNILPADVVVTRTVDPLSNIDGGALGLALKGGSDRLILAGLTDGPGIDQVRFANGTSWTAAMLEGLAGTLNGTDTADNLSGDDTNNKLYGLAGNDALTGRGGNDLLDGGPGQDTMVGNEGDDTYVVDASTDLVTEQPNQGSDSVLASVSYTLPTHVEDLTLMAGAVSGTGNSGNNRFTGNATNNSLKGEGGHDTLDGGAGIDTLAGGAGDDLYVVDTATDTITEAASAGADTVASTVTIKLAANVEHLVLAGSAAIAGTGNDLANLLTGNSAANALAGGLGNDTLDGGAGNDSLSGGPGDDSYVVDTAADTLTELVNEGVDTVRSSVTLALGTNLEHLVLTGSAAISGVGNTLNNMLTGNSAANTLDGGAGNDTLDGSLGIDTLIGGTGDDSFIVDSGDQVNESAAGGTDSVLSSISWALAANLERLTLLGTAHVDGTGNGANNVLTGNAGNNLLDGGAGADTLAGGIGNDVYVVDHSADVVTERPGEGDDRVRSSVSFTLSENIEGLVLTGNAAVAGTGNTGANLIEGNSTANVLSGAAGADTLYGGAGGDTLDGGTGNDMLAGGVGDDTYLVDALTDAVIEASEEGSDEVRSTVTWTLGSGSENLVLLGTSPINGTGNEADNRMVGNAAANTLVGSAGNDSLDGGAGIDLLVGGDGDDTYYVDVAGDVVSEAVDAGTDLVISSVNHTLRAHVENLRLSGSAGISGTGNELDNLLTGNAAANQLSGGDGQDTLDGGLGNDSLSGGAGDDTYLLDSTADFVNEASGAGFDLAFSSATWTTSAEVEVLVLTGTANVNGTGNAMDNGLYGNGAANTLSSGAGNDHVDGGAGNDILIGGTGGDTYYFARGHGIDTVRENDNTPGVLDHVDMTVFESASLARTDVQFVRATNNLEMLVLGSTDKLVFENWYLGAPYQVEAFHFSDGIVLSNLQAQALVGAMASFGATNRGETMGVIPRTTIPDLQLAPSTMV